MLEIATPDAKGNWTVTYDLVIQKSGEDPDPETPEVPGLPEIEDLLDSKIIVQCTTNPDEHPYKPYGLLTDGYALAEEVSGSAEDGWTYEITIYPSAYVAEYNSEGWGKHSSSESEPLTRTITLEYTENGWEYLDAPITIDVTCEGDEPVEPTEPTLPDGDEVLSALEKSIILECLTLPVDHDKQFYDLLPGTYEVDKASLSYNNGSWTLEVTIFPDAFLKEFNSTYQTTEGHVLVDENDRLAGGKAILTYADGSWTCLSGNGVTFEVTCSGDEPVEPTEPTLPDGDEVLSALEKSIILECLTLPVDHDKQFYDLLPGTYEVDKASLSYNNGSWTLEVTILPDAYLKEFNSTYQTTEGHVLVDENDRLAGGKAILTYADGSWTCLSGNGVTFEVTCSGDEPVEPTEPTLPDGDEVLSALEKSIILECLTLPVDHDKQFYDLLPGTYEVDKASLSYNNGSWTLEVTIFPDAYLKEFNSTYQTTEGHVLVDENDRLAGGKAILTYADGSWTCLSGNGVTFEVMCQTSPEPDTYTVTFNTNGGTTDSWDQSVTDGDTLTLDATASWDDQHISWAGRPTNRSRTRSMARVTQSRKRKRPSHRPAM